MEELVHTIELGSIWERRVLSFGRRDMGTLVMGIVWNYLYKKNIINIVNHSISSNKNK